MMPATLSIITQAFPPHQRGMAIGTWAGVSAMALAIGPVLGGFLTQDVSWRAIFFINPPIAVVAVAVTLFATRESRDETVARTVDYPGIATITVGLTAIVLALVEGNHWGWGSTRVVALLAVALVLLVSFVVIERRIKVPMVDFSFFRSRTFLGTNIVAFLISFAMLAMFFFLALYMQNVLHYSPLGTGRPLPPRDRPDHRHGSDRRPVDRPDRSATADDGRPCDRRGVAVRGFSDHRPQRLPAACCRDSC